MKNMTEMLVDSVELQLNHHTLGQDFSVEIGERGSQGALVEEAGRSQGGAREEPGNVWMYT